MRDRPTNDESPAEFSQSRARTRWERAHRQIASDRVTGALIGPGPDLEYLTRYQPPPAVARHVLLVVPSDQEPTLFVPVSLVTTVESLVADGVDVRGTTANRDLHSHIAEVLPYGKRVGFSEDMPAGHLSRLQALRPDVEFVPLTATSLAFRIVKDAEEISLLKDAAAAADACFDTFTSTGIRDLSDRELAERMIAAMHSHGYDHIDFVMVDSGTGTARPHHETLHGAYPRSSERRIAEGDPVLIDFGGIRNGYGSDLARTVVADRTPDATLRSVHEVVREALEAAMSVIRPGASCKDIDAAARSVIDEAGYGDFYPHMTGHGVGMTTFEPPYIDPGELGRVASGMCFSLEPAVYLPGRFGVRLEDVVVVTESGVERLTRSDHTVRVV
ncbi:M24 family metallopeptidase [Stackebrandtia soli]|uniref:M24 family metallopeptidase n=1 Tax=Stackebrandtia soli TaxID=1892856 RepID=UPI0039ECFDBB